MLLLHHLQAQRLAVGQDGFSCGGQFIEIGLAEEIEAQAQDAIEDHVNDEPDEDQVHNGFHNTPGRLGQILKRPIPQEHVLPQPHQNHHGQIENERIRKGSHRTPRVAEDIPGKPGDSKKDNK
ncbi:hypothetical protein [Desulfacinum hydrothermale]|uniref:hypothetical protein n=1 Tax=Desulfacinum hydrothermale TaxID=109258 RepID=UPI003CCBD8C1